MATVAFARRSAVIVAVAVLVFAAAGAAALPHRLRPGFFGRMTPGPTCTVCTAAQCAEQTCPATLPFVCLAGRSAGGCADSASSWNNGALCSVCCDASACPKPTPPPGPTPLDCAAACSTAVCDSPLGHSCGSTAPFVCTSGNAVGGCSGSSSGWAAPQCKSCCDSALCPKQTTAPGAPASCPACTKAQCGTEQCSATAPYMCAAGPSMGGCAGSPSAWSNPALCSACCNTASC